MTDQAAARRMRMLEVLRSCSDSRDLASYAREFGVDDRTIRRDIDYLQGLLSEVGAVGLHRGVVYASRERRGPGYFADHVEQHRAEKEAISRAVVDALADNVAVSLTAGSTTYFVARELRRRAVECERPHSLIVFTNSLPALVELTAAGVSTGVLGEVYNADDHALHAHEYHSGFHASVAIVGASGVWPNPTAGTLELFSHRAEEAAFLKQVLAPIPEICVAVDASKLGHRHPWSFTGGGVLAGKAVRLFTSAINEEQRDSLRDLSDSARRSGWSFTYYEAALAVDNDGE